MANEIVGFDDLIFVLNVVLSELIIKCVIEFGRFAKILKDQLN
jgi:hypothetical protein